ncbi:MAG TPA: efflux RND transporter periplasmic adaptor subunit [Sphingomicrobium sp.]|nr:efflux RND transporter periplasmic adaptor subunit [Sphingomicrobium sp.]
MNRETIMQGTETLIVVDRSNRRRNLIIAAVAVAAILLMAFLAFGRGGSDQSGPGAAASGGGRKAGGQMPTVTVIVPGRSDVARLVTASGALAARRDQPVGVSGEGGRVAQVFVDAGSWVRQGQVLASIDRSVQGQEAAQLAAQIQVARADSALAQSEFERSQSLVGRGFVSKADLDRKRAARDAAAARVRVAQSILGASRARIGRLDVRAPSDGLILVRSVEVGQIVGAGSGGLFRLARGGEMEMRASLSQQDLALVQPGMAASVSPIGTERSLSGRIWQISPVIDPQSRQGEVRIAIPYDPSIRPGGFAEARISAGGSTAPLLPQSAVLSDEKGNYVYIVNAKNEVERRDIKVGSVDNVGVTITAGLSGQESIVLSAGPFLNPGQKIAPRRQAAR